MSAEAYAQTREVMDVRSLLFYIVTIEKCFHHSTKRKKDVAPAYLANNAVSSTLKPTKIHISYKLFREEGMMEVQFTVMSLL